MAPTLLLDAAGTLIRTAEPVGEVYARHFAAAGMAISPAVVHDAFVRAFAAAPPPEFGAFVSGHDAERSRWRTLVGAVLSTCGPEAAAFGSSAAFLPCFERLYSHYAVATAWELFPDTLPFLESARRRTRLAVVSNFDSRLPPVLQGLGITPYLDEIVTSGDARASKPDPAIFAFALQRLGISPDQAVHVGDCLQADISGAHAAGIAAFHLRRPGLTLIDFLEFCEIPAT